MAKRTLGLLVLLGVVLTIALVVGSPPRAVGAPKKTRTPVSTATPTQTVTVGPTATAAATSIPGESTISFPARGFFYYGWFAESWTQGGVYPFTNYTPSRGYYDSGDPAIAAAHVADMVYGGGDIAIASWWGSDHWTDDHLPVLLDAAAQSSLKVGLYYEDEGFANVPQTTISRDLDYLLSTYGAHPAAARVAGELVVFVYNADDTTCAVADKWRAAVGTRPVHYVLKVFAGYTGCASQPDGWHQYGPAVGTDAQGSYSFSISPGYWKQGEAVRLPRDPAVFAGYVRAMVESGARWQLVTTYNEWGEGTSVESATGWESSSGFGVYLDILHRNGQG